MASQWYLKTDDTETGPISFQELADLVRSNTVSAADLVRPDWKADWQRAETVVGLFYMARQSTAPAEPVVPAAAAPALDTPRDGFVNEITPVATEPPQPPWMLRLLQIIRGKSTPPQSRMPVADSLSKLSSALPGDDPDRMPQATGYEVDLASLEYASPADETLQSDLPMHGTVPEPYPGEFEAGGLSDAIAAALIDTEIRTNRRHGWSLPSRLTRFFARAGNSWVRVGFRLALGILCAFFVVREVEAVSTEETSRIERQAFLMERQAAMGLQHRPAKSALPSVARRYFPLLGECERTNYTLLLAGLALSTTTLVYAAGKLLEWSIKKWLESKQLLRSMA